MAGWKNFEVGVGRLLGDLPTARGEMQTSGLPQPDGDIVTRGSYLDGLHVECKRRKNLSVPKWFRETEEAAGDGPFLLVAKRYGIADISRAYALTDLGTVTRWLRHGYKPEESL